MSQVRVKICGLTTAATIDSAVSAGAAYLGFNFFPKSPRFVTYAAAAGLAVHVPPGVAKVGLVVNVDDAMIDDLVSAVPLDMIQLHGTETPGRVSEIKARTGLPVIKAIGISSAEDLDNIDRFSDVADQLLVDAKAPKGAELPGGNGLPFDWQLLAGRKYWRRPWLLAGGLVPENVAEAIRLTGARQVDVSSGVESAPGVKDDDRIRAFMAQCG